MSRASGKPNGVFQRRNDTMEREREKWKRGKISKYTKKLSTHLLFHPFIPRPIFQVLVKKFQTEVFPVLIVASQISFDFRGNELTLFIYLFGVF